MPAIAAPIFAAIDIGSNSCRLKIAKVVAHQLRTLHEDREVTRLGAGVFATGLVSPVAMAATIQALKRFQRAVQLHGAGRVRVVATAAMRDARNGKAFQTWVKTETGWDLEIISGLEEGRLIHLGMVSASTVAARPESRTKAGKPRRGATASQPEKESSTAGRVLLVDLGGGSCEITLSEHKHIRETVSLPLGAVRLAGEFLSADPAPPEGLARMRQFIARELRRAHQRIHPEHITHVIATSGTAAALSEAIAALGKKNGGRTGKLAGQAAQKIAGKTSRKTNGKTPRKTNSGSLPPGLAPAHEIRLLATKLAKLPLAGRAAIAGIGPRRAEIIVPGALVFAELMESFGLPGFCYSPLGLRDGMLAQMLAEQDERATAHLEFERMRWQSVVATAERYGVDPRRAEPVRAHAVQLYRALQPLHRLPPEYEGWLAAAALLRDTGKFINHQGHHRHTQYIVSSSEIYGTTPVQRTLISSIARYLGKSRPQPGDRALRNIPPAEHPHVQRAVLLLRLAVALNQDRASDVLRFTARVYPKRICLELEPGRTGAELELWSLRKEAAYFREVFGRELFCTLA